MNKTSSSKDKKDDKDTKDSTKKKESKKELNVKRRKHNLRFLAGLGFNSPCNAPDDDQTGKEQQGLVCRPSRSV